MRRTIQNRLAQRAFRKRKDNRIKELEEQVAELVRERSGAAAVLMMSRSSAAKNTNQPPKSDPSSDNSRILKLEQRIKELENENQYLRSSKASHLPTSYCGSLSAAPVQHAYPSQNVHYYNAASTAYPYQFYSQPMANNIPSIVHHAPQLQLQQQQHPSYYASTYLKNGVNQPNIPHYSPCAEFTDHVGDTLRQDSTRSNSNNHLPQSQISVNYIEQTSPKDQNYPCAQDLS
ncbi:hypothetical protein BDR26DRAFT_852515 [Obelidium mucronatum]|nr:hypothetical protein BDR26DRAFT_852515 [Obelidium mucronatum]